MPDREDCDNWPEESDSVYEDELEKDWGRDFDDFDPSFWEKYYGGPDNDPNYDFQEEDENEEFEEDEEKLEHNERDSLEDLLTEYVSVNQELENLKERFEELREKIGNISKSPANDGVWIRPTP